MVLADFSLETRWGGSRVLQRVMDHLLPPITRACERAKYSKQIA